MSDIVTSILLVEDDENLGYLIKDNLKGMGWNILLYPDGEKGLTAFHNHKFDLCILDVMLPRKDGFALAVEIRRYDPQVPIVFLTAKDHPDDRIKGFQSGADDYVCKPFSIEEFKYRIEAVLKRSYGRNSSADKAFVLCAGRSTLDLDNLLLTVNGTQIRLTHKEGKLLAMFFRHKGKLIERDHFLQCVWEEEGFFVARSMDVFVSRLRKHLKDDNLLAIENVRGVGYVMKERRGF